MNYVRNIQTKILSTNWAILKKLTYEYCRSDQTWEEQTREVYDRGNGVTILLYNPQRDSVILTKQFRIPTYLNGHVDGHMIETPAGKLEREDPESCIKREVMEETGYQLNKVKKIFELYMSPGSVTELIHFFIGEYNDKMKISSGGGHPDEQENIEVLELPVTEALSMIKDGRIRDAKTVILLQYAQNLRSS